MSLLELSDQITHRPDGYRSTWGIVSNADPLTVALQGVGLPVPVDWESEAASPVGAGDKVLVRRHGQGGWIYIDRIVPASYITDFTEGITSLQPFPSSPEPGQPGAPTVPTDPAGQFPTFARMNAPSNVRITDIVWNEFTVRFDYTRSTNPSAPTETGFQVDIIELATGDVVSTEYASTAERNKRIGSLRGSAFYRARVRAITDQTQFGTYTRPQIDYLLSHYDQTIVNYYSQWAESARQQTDAPPVSPVFPPINVRWGRVGVDEAAIAWDYQPLPSSATATGFQVKACQNSIGSLSCQQHLAASTARSQTVTRLADNQRIWGFVRTVAGSQYSRWVAIGPPRRTLRDYTPEFRNWSVRRAAADSDDILWSVEVRNASQFRYTTRFAPTLDVAGTLFVGSPLVIQYPTQDITGGFDRQGWATISYRQTNAYHGRGIYTVTLDAFNSFGREQSSQQLIVRNRPLFVGQRVSFIGNRGSILAFYIASLLPFGRGTPQVATDLASRFLVTYVRETVSGLGRIYAAARAAGATFAKSAVLVGRSAGTLTRLSRNVWVNAAGSRVVAQTAGATSLGIAGNILTGLGILASTQYLGWESIEWELGVSAGGGPYSRDFFGTLTRPADWIEGETVLIERQVERNIYNTVLRVNYFAPNASIRFRTRAANADGTTGLNDTFVQPNDFVFVNHGPPADGG